MLVLVQGQGEERSLINLSKDCVSFILFHLSSSISTKIFPPSNQSHKTCSSPHPATLAMLPALGLRSFRLLEGLRGMSHLERWERVALSGRIWYKVQWERKGSVLSTLPLVSKSTSSKSWFSSWMSCLPFQAYSFHRGNPNLWAHFSLHKSLWGYGGEIHRPLFQKKSYSMT